MPLNIRVKQAAAVNPPAPVRSQQPAMQNTTAYRQNIAAPAKQDWQIGMRPTTTGQMLATVYNASDANQGFSQETLNTLNRYRSQPGNDFYQAYWQPTSKGANRLQSMGVDTGALTDDWLQKHPGWESHLRRDSATGEIRDPGEHASFKERAAYGIYQYTQAEGRTRKAEQELQALNEEVAYWARRDDLNLSDDDILGRINMTKYPTLAEMRKTAQQGGDLVELNRGVNYSDDALRGTIWATRNGADPNDTDRNTANYYLKKGKMWEAGASQERLNPNSASYNPYAVGMTANDEGLYFGVKSFSRQWVDNNRDLLNSQDQTEAAAYKSVLRAEADTRRAEEAAEKLKSNIDKLLSAGRYSEEDIIGSLDSMLDQDEFGILAQMEDSLKKGPDSILKLTRKVDFGRNDLISYIHGVCEENAKKQDAVDMAGEIYGVQPNTAEDRFSAGMKRPSRYTGGRGIETQAPAVSPTPAPGEAPAAEAPAATPAPVETPAPAAEVPNPAPTLKNGPQRRLTGRPLLSPADLDEMRRRDQNASAASLALSGKTTATEDGYLTYSSQGSQPVQDYLAATPTDELAQSNMLSQCQSYTGEMIPMLGAVNATAKARKDLEEAQAALPRVQEEIARLSSGVVANEDELDRLNSIKGPYMPEWVYAAANPETDDRTRTEALVDLYRYVTRNQDYQYGDGTGEELSLAASWADYILNGEYTETAMTDEERDLLPRYHALETQYQKTIQNSQQTIDDNAESEKRYNEQLLWMDETIKAYEADGIDAADLKAARAVTGYLGNLSEYQPARWGTDSYYQEAADAGEDPAALYEDNLAALDDARWVLDYITKNEIQVPEDYRRNLERQISDLELYEKDYQYYNRQFADGFAESAESGRQAEAETLNGRFRGLIPTSELRDDEDAGIQNIQGGLDHAYYSQFMTQAQKDTYYNLYAEGGEEAAWEYYKHLAYDTRVLQAQASKNVEERAEKEVNSGAGNAVLANIKAVFSTLFEGGLGLSYTADSVVKALTGEEINPYDRRLDFAKYSAQVQESTMNVIHEEFAKKNPALDKLLSGVYEIAYNNGRSTLNAVAFGGLNAGIANPVLQEIIGASNMAAGAMSMTISDATERGANPGQALLLGGITYVGESFSEGLTASNIHDMVLGIRAGSPASLKDALVDWLTKEGFEEAAGEVANSALENWADTTIMGDASEHADRVRQWVDKLREANPDLDEGSLRQMAEEQAERDELTGYLHTALVSYFSPGLNIVTGQVKSSAERVMNYRLMSQTFQQAGMDIGIREVREMYKTRDEQLNNPEAAPEENAAPVAEENAAPVAEESVTAQPQTAEERFAPRRRRRMDRYADGQDTQTQEAAVPATTEGETAAAKPETAEGRLAPRVRRMTRYAEGRGIQSADTTAPANPDDTFTRDASVLNSVAGKSAPVSTTAVSSILNDGQTRQSAAVAKAAAVKLNETFGGAENAVSTIKTLLAGAKTAGVSSASIKSALQIAVLAPHSNAAMFLNSSAYQQATPAQRAQILSEIGQRDARNGAVLDEMNGSVQEGIKADFMAAILADGAGKPAVEARAKINAARKQTKRAERQLAEKQTDLQKATDAVKAAETEVQRDPAAGAPMMAEALHKLATADTVEQQMAQSVEAQRENEEQVRTAEEQKIDEVMTDVRAQADQSYQQMQAEEAQIAEEQRVAEEARLAEEAQLQAEEDAVTGKDVEDRDTEAIDSFLDTYGYEGEDREQERKQMLALREQVKYSKFVGSNVNTPEGFMAVSSFSRKLGMQIKLEDLGDPRVVRGKYENGVVYLNRNRLRNGDYTVGQAMVEAALHEITHSMETTKSYGTYRDVVLGSLFNADSTTAEALYADNAEYRAAIDQKIADYKNVGQELSVSDAEKEIVADFARTRLNDRDTVSRLIDRGLGWKMKSTLHNINEAMKNFYGKLKGEDRTQAEYLRRAERTFQKMMDEAAKQEIHPEGGQFSIAQIAQATGMTFDENTLELRDTNGNVVDGVNYRITPDMIRETPVGMLIQSGLSNQSSGVDEMGNQKPSQQAAAMDMMAGLMNMVARYKDSDLVWEIGASTLSSTFSALKSNSDPQYATTVDFGTVCAKTQAIIDVMSQVMLQRVREGKSGGLTRDDIMKVYDATHNAGLSVPCPVCYVFSRWMGVPSLLGQMSQYQKDYVVTAEDGETINREETQKKVDAYLQNAEQYGDAKAINKRKAKLQSALVKLEEQESIASPEEAKDLRAKMVEVKQQLDEVDAYNWITQALCKLDKNTGKYVVDPKFKVTPDEILFDLNRTGEFAGYEKNWRYRNTRGAGMGKAIMPYSGESIGDILYGVKNTGRQNVLKNPWLKMDPKAAARQLSNARTRAKQQNLIGGQRLQSTSDFRPEWGLDYIMSFLELQAAGSKVQMYTKVPEAVDLFASVGADVNLSIMGKGQGWHVDENGNRVLDFSSITGMDYETAKALKNKYDNVQMILVGMNDTHIRLAMANDDIDFIIPWHSSGNSQDTLKTLIGTLGEKLLTGVDYTTTQTDMVKGTVKKYTDENGNKVEYTVPGKQTAEEKALWDARVKLLTKGGDALTQAERSTLLSNPYTADLYKRFTEKGVDPDCYGVKLKKSQAEQIFPYEYWDTSSTKENADVNGKRFAEYCEAMGIVPRFSQFKDDPGYWKLLIDRPMYNNDESYHRQQTIDVTGARIGSLDESGSLTDSDLPKNVKTAKYATKDPRSEHYAEYTEKERQAKEKALALLDEKYDAGTPAQLSVFGDQTEADRAVLQEAARDYQDALGRGDMEAAAEDVESYAASKGYTLKVYHGTPSKFTEFNKWAPNYLTPSETYAENYGDVMHLYLKPEEVFDPSANDEARSVFNNEFLPYEVQKGRMTQNEANELRLNPGEMFDFTVTDDLYSFMKRYNRTHGTKYSTLKFFENGAFVAGEESADIAYIPLDNALIKSADTVTYDNQGNVIPLEERFNDQTGDVRYSAMGDQTEADMALETDIDSMLDNLTTEELNDLFGFGEETSEEEARQKLTVAVQDLKDEFDPTIYNGRLYVKPETLDYWLSGQGFASTSPGYAQAYITMMDPADFLRMTTATEAGQQAVLDSSHRLNDEELGENATRQPIQLLIDESAGKVTGHEGRHRAVALARAGVTQMPVLLFDSATKYSKTAKDSLTLEGQNPYFRDDVENGNTLTFSNVIPLSSGNADLIREQFTASEADRQMAGQNGQRIVQYSSGGDQTEADMALSAEADRMNNLINMGVLTQQEVDEFNALSNPEDGGRAQRQFGSKTAQESDALHDEVKEYLRNHSGYDPDSNAEQINRAIDWVRSRANENDPDGYRAAVDAVTSDSFDYRSADGQAQMLTVMSMAAMKNDLDTEMRLADAYNRQGTDLGRSLQARKIFRMMTPLGRKAYFKKQVDNLNADIGRKTGKNGTIAIDPWLLEAAGAAETEEDFQRVRTAIAKQVGEQIPANWKDKLRSWRMLAMLGNPRTHIRNVIGNALFVPAVSLKNKLGAAMELGLKKGERTKTLRVAVPKDIRTFARADAETMRSELTGEAKYNEEDLIQQNRKQFRGVMQILSDFNSNALEKEDWIFLRGHYRRALGGWIQANGYTAEQVQENPELLEKARAYAIQEAQKATYRDFNGLAKRLNDLARNPETTGQKVLAFATEAVLPFKKTPANILKRGLEYSPIGIARSLTADLVHLKQYRDYQAGKLDVLPDTAITPNQFIDGLCSGLTGTAVMALGAILGSMGVVSCGLGDDDDEFEKIKGKQDYSIKFSIGGDDYTFTLDWAAPMCMPFFVGAAIQEQFANEDGLEADVNGIVNAFGSITEPVFNLSMLDGVNSLISMFASGEDPNATLTQLGAKVGTNYLSSYIPSALGATTRTFFDTTRRKAFVESGKGSGVMGTLRYAREQMENKIPGLSQTNIPYRDVWGNPEESGLTERFLENFILPGYVKQYKDDPIVNELQALGAVPKEAAKKFTQNDETYILNAEQWDAYKTTRGQNAYNLLGLMFDHPYYQAADPDTRRALVDVVWDNADQLGREAAIPELKGEDEPDMDPQKRIESIIEYVDDKITKKRVKANKNHMITSLDNGDLEGYNAMVQALRDDGVTDKSIKEKIGDTYRDQYKAAYRIGDYAKMDEIESLLNSTGYEFDMKGWEKAVDKESGQVTRSIPGFEAQYDNTLTGFVGYLAEQSAQGGLDQISMVDFFEQMQSLTGNNPWSVLSDLVSDYVDFKDPNLKTSVADLEKYLEENGSSLLDILSIEPGERRAAALRPRAKRVVNEGKGVKRGEAIVDQPAYQATVDGVNYLDQVASGENLTGGTQATQQLFNTPQEINQTFDGDYSKVQSFDHSWLPYYSAENRNPIWDEDAPEEAKLGQGSDYVWKEKPKR